MIKTLYLAGPDVFFPNPQEVGESKKALCRQYGFEGLFPLDNAIEGQLTPRELSEAIYRGNLELMNRADAILANITPFRGPNMDPGTAFEIGYFTALSKPVFLYSNDARPYKHRVSETTETDIQGHSIEDFGDLENLMIVRAARQLPIPAAPVPERDYFGSLVNFETALQRIRQDLS